MNLYFLFFSGDDEESGTDSADEAKPTDKNSIPSFLKQLHKEYVQMEGESLKLQVEVIGNPKPKVEWYFEDEKIISDELTQITEHENMYTLFIKQTVLEDEGFYKCTATNKTGQVYIETEVLVDEVEEGEGKIEDDEEEEVVTKNDILNLSQKAKVAPPAPKPKPKVMIPTPVQKEPPVFVKRLESSQVSFDYYQ